MFCFNVLFLSKRFRSSPSWICFGLKCFPRRYSRKPNGWNLQMEVWWMILLFYRGGCSRSADLRGACQFWKKNLRVKKREPQNIQNKIPLLGIFTKTKVHPKSRNFSSRGFYSYRVIGGTGWRPPDSPTWYPSSQPTELHSLESVFIQISLPNVCQDNLWSKLKPNEKKKQKKNIYSTPPRSLTARPWKMMVGRQAFPYGMVYFQGRAVKLPGGS